MICVRNNTCWFLLIAVGVFSSCVFEDPASPKPEQVYVKYYGGAGLQSISDMIVNSAENIIILGDQTRAVAGANGNAYVIETDSLGNEMNSMFFDVGLALNPDSSYITEEFTESIKEFPDGYLVTGTFAELRGGQTQQFNIFWAWLGTDLSIQKLDTIRTGPYNAQGANADHVYGRDIVQTRDGNIVIVGKTTRREVNDLTVNAGDQYFLIKRDFNADTTIWRKSYGYRNSDDDAIFVQELNDGRIALIGSTFQVGNGGGTGQNVGVMVFNELATSQVTAQVFGVSIGGDNSAMDQPNDVIVTSSGFVVVGTSTIGQVQRPFLMGILDTGAKIFGRSLSSKWENGNLNMQGYSVTQTRANDLVVAGAYPEFEVTDPAVDISAQSKNSEILFMRTGQSGFEKRDFESNFGLVSGDDVGKVTCTLSSGAILIGATIDFGSNQTMIGVMKLNDQGVLQR